MLKSVGGAPEPSNTTRPLTFMPGCSTSDTSFFVRPSTLTSALAHIGGTGGPPGPGPVMPLGPIAASVRVAITVIRTLPPELSNDTNVAPPERAVTRY